MGIKKLLFLSAISGVFLSYPWISQSFPFPVFFAFVPLLIVEDQIVMQRETQKSIFLFLNALLTFFIWNVLSTWWIAYVSVSGMIIITGVNSFLMATVWWLMHLVRRKLTAQTGYFSLVVFWLTFEFLHFNWSINWPWLTLGNAFANSVKLIQWYEFTGVLGGSLWILLSNILIFSLAKSILKKPLPEVVKFGGLSLAIILLPICLSVILYSNYKENGEVREAVVLQPNIDAYNEKFSGLSAEEQTHRLISLAETIVNDSTDYILAPETAIAQMWENQEMKQNEALMSINSLIDKYPNVRFIVGVLTNREISCEEPFPEKARKTEDGRFYKVFNSALLIDHSHNVQIGHKSLLVSGVEKMPFEKYLLFFRKFMVDLGGVNGSLSSANQITVFEGTNHDKIGSVICFESAFGEFTGSAAAKGANLIFVITNDGWWKDSPGVWQHFSYSRMRAIETRRNIVRSGNTGISGFIDSRGNVLEKTKTNTSTAISSEIQTNNSETFYVTYGDFLGRVSLILSGLTLIYLVMNLLFKTDIRN